MPERQEPEPNKADIEYATNLYGHVVNMSHDWRNIDEVKARLIIEYSRDAIDSFGKTNQEKKVELRGIIERAEQVISPDSVDDLKKRVEKLFLRFTYPKNPTYRNVLLVSLGTLMLGGLMLSMISPLTDFLKHSEPSNSSLNNTNKDFPKQSGSTNSSANTSNVPKSISTPNMDVSQQFPDGKVMGVNVRDNNGEIDWNRVDRNLVSFVIVRATEGAASTDQRFQANWDNLKRAGIIRGAYHTFNPKIDATTQANHFTETVHLDKEDLPPILDLEYPESAKPLVKAMLVHEVRDWLRLVQQQTGRRPMIVTNSGFWDEHMTYEFNDYPLWVMKYINGPGSQELPKREIPKTSLPKGWGTWSFWQFTESFPIAGIGQLDANLFNGSYDDLKGFIRDH